MARELLPRSNLGLRLLSLVIAVVLFLVVRGERQVGQRFTVPLEARLPVGIVAASPLPPSLTISVFGPWARVRSLRGADIGPVMLDLSSNGPGTTSWFVRAESFHLPTGVHVESIYPSQGSIELLRR